MNIQEMSQINAMEARVRDAHEGNVLELADAIPVLVDGAMKSPREIKLQMLTIARSIILRIEELVPEIQDADIWKPYSAMKGDLNKTIMETRFMP